MLEKDLYCVIRLHNFESLTLEELKATIMNLFVQDWIEIQRNGGFTFYKKK